MNGFHCPYCGKFLEEISPEFAAGIITCTCGNRTFWHRILTGHITDKVHKFHGRYELTMKTDVG